MTPPFTGSARLVRVGHLVALGLASLLLPTAAHGQVVELTDGPVANSNRVVGLGGAYVGIGEGADGQRVNPAAFATRYTYTRNDYFDWDFTFYSFTAPDGEGSIDLSGEAGAVDGASMVGFGLDFKLGIFGFGFHLFGKNYDVSLQTESEGVVTPRTFRYANNLGLLGLAWAIPVIDTTIGISPMAGNFSVLDADGNILAELSGAGFQFGALWQPEGRPFRVGASYRTAFSALDTVIEPPPDLVATPPDGLEVPAQFRLGASYMLGERIYNPPQNYGSEKHFGDGGPDELARDYLLLSAEAVVTGRTAGAVGAQSYAAGAPLASGDDPTIGLHTGMEWEFLPNWARARAGYYWEPSRIDQISGRHHVTTGADLKVPVVWDFKLQAVLDVARDYLNIGFGFGLWY